MPRLLDLYAGGGGAAMGYARAGWEVVGVDLIRWSGYPFDLIVADALTYPLDGFDAIHASPPCKAHTTARNRDRQALHLFDPYDDQLTPTLARLQLERRPWVVENVVGSPMPPSSVRYCGSSFGLDVRRHRLFASNVPLVAPPCDHGWQTPRFKSLDIDRHRRGLAASVVGVHGHLQGDGDTWELRQRAMGIDWLTGQALNQAIPPAFTEHIGRQLLDHLERAAA